MMRVHVRLFGEFRRVLRETDGHLTLDVVEGTTVRNMLERVHIPEAEVGLVSVNSELAAVETAHPATYSSTTTLLIDYFNW